MIIALTGPAGCGKSTLAQALVDRHDFVRVRFAGILKDMLRTLGLTAEQVDGAEKETPCDLLCGRSPRVAMQTLGTEWGRSMIGADLWVRATMRHVDDLLAGQRDVVIDDLRFDNEARALASRDAIIVQLTRGQTPYSPACDMFAGPCSCGAWHRPDEPYPQRLHASEQGIAPAWITSRLANDGTIEQAVDTLHLLIETTRARGRHGL